MSFAEKTRTLRHNFLKQKHFRTCYYYFDVLSVLTREISSYSSEPRPEFQKYLALSITKLTEAVDKIRNYCGGYRNLQLFVDSGATKLGKLHCDWVEQQFPCWTMMDNFGDPLLDWSLSIMRLTVTLFP